MHLHKMEQNEKEVFMNGANEWSQRYMGQTRRLSCRDSRAITLLEDCYCAELSSVAAYTYRSLVTEGISGELSTLLDRIAVDECEHFRLVGSIIVSMGGNPVIRSRVQTEPYDFAGLSPQKTEITVCRMLREAMQEEREEIDRYQTLMGRTDDRVLRSFLAQIIADEERHVVGIKSMM